MKNLVKVVAVSAVVLVAGCANRECDTCQYQAPARPVYYQPAPAADCNGCGTKVRTVREPVEVVYKRTTQKTVYEPKTYSNVTYEREAYKAPCNEAEFY